jgi:hypothetical protein
LRKVRSIQDFDGRLLLREPKMLPKIDTHLSLKTLARSFSRPRVENLREGSGYYFAAGDSNLNSTPLGQDALSTLKKRCFL